MTDQPAQHLPTREGYDLWAESYDADDNPLIAIEEPRMAELLGDVRGLDVADIGCGTGRHALRLVRAGARVAALDFSDAMLAKARQRGIGLNLTFQVHDLAQPLPWPDRSFDRVVCGLVLDHIAGLDLLFQQMRRVCRAEGWLVISVMHPAMMLRGVQARFRDPASGQEMRPASCPHQISDYICAAARAGLSIDHLSEHAVDETLATRHARAAKYLGWPLLFLMKLRP